MQKKRTEEFMHQLALINVASLSFLQKRFDATHAFCNILTNSYVAQCYCP